MASVTLTMHSLSLPELRAALVAHNHEHDTDDQPVNSATTYIREHDRAIGAFVRVEGPECFSMTTLPLTAASAALVARAVVDA